MIAATRYTQPCTLVLFGATGDLARTKLFPQFAELLIQHRMGSNFSIIAYGRSAYTTESFRSYLSPFLTDEQQILLLHITYLQGEYEDPTLLYQVLEHEHNDRTLLYYFALPAEVSEEWVTKLCHHHPLGKKASYLMEKPFGTSRASAKILCTHLEQCIGKEQLFLIDHYLGKSAIQSIFYLNNSNPLLRHGLAPKHIQHISIELLETDDVEHRLGYYDHMGVIKDMVHSHITQLIALTLLRCTLPISYDHLQKEKHRIISHLQIHPDYQSTFGQYKGYSGKEKTTPTSIRTTLQCTLPEWKHVPILIETGKKYTKKHSAITITIADRDHPSQTNTLTYELYPEERLHINLTNSYNSVEESTPVPMESASSMSCHGDDCLPPYARLFLHALHGISSSFLSIEEIQDAWKLTENLETLQKSSKLLVY